MVRCAIFMFWLAIGQATCCMAQTPTKRLPPLPQDTLPRNRDIHQLPSHLSLNRTIPDDNRLTVEKVALGRALFFDPLLSADRTVSCASCHQPEHGFASPDRLAVGIAGQIGERNAPSVLNRAFGGSFFWDGRAASLEEQALKPIENSKELGTSIDVVLGRLQSDARYVELFRQAFPSREPAAAGTSEQPITAEHLAKALAAFQRTLLLGDSSVDRFQSGEYAALNGEQRKGLWLFESRAACWKCHSGDNYTDESFHNTGIGHGKTNRDLGRFRVTGRDRDRARFKTPSLRGVAQTAPYMHDGSLATLRDVVDFYNRGGEANDPNLDTRIKPLGLTDEESNALVAFLEALSDSKAQVSLSLD